MGEGLYKYFKVRKVKVFYTTLNFKVFESSGKLPQISHTNNKAKREYSRHKTAVKTDILPATQSTLGAATHGAYFIPFLL